MIDCEEKLLDYYGANYLEWQQALHGSDYERTVLMNEVHDELTWDLTADSELEKEIILQTMSEPPSLRKLLPDFTIPLKVDPKISDRWGLTSE
jgi:hypothetical protein